MKKFFQAMLGAVVVGAIVAYFFGPFWFWLLMILALIGGIQVAREERQYSKSHGDLSGIDAGPHPKDRDRSPYKAKNAAENSVPVDPSSSKDSRDALGREFLRSEAGGNRNCEPSLTAEVPKTMPNDPQKEQRKAHMGEVGKIGDGLTQAIMDDIAGDKQRLGVAAISQRRAPETEGTSSSVNPFSHPFSSLLKSLSGIKWTFPFLPQVIESVVLILALSVTAILYLTVGIASQIERTLLGLMRNSGTGASSSNVIERSAYAIAGGIYLVVWLPFWLALLPFNFLGWLWQTFGYGGIVALLLVIATITGVVYWGVDLGSVFDSMRYWVGLPS